MSDLISREAAIAAIEATKLDFPETDFVVDNSARIGLSRAVDEVSAVPSPWISVNSRLPEEDKRVLIYDDVCREVCVANLHEGTWHGEAYQEEHDASHWMELPAPPVG